MIRRIRNILKEYPNLPAMASTGWNLAYGLFNGILALLYASWWFLTLAVFYGALGLMRLSAVTSPFRSRSSEKRLMRINGGAMILLSIVLTGMMVLTIHEGQNPIRHRIVMIAIAAVTFFLAGWSIRNIVRAYMEKTPAQITLRNISCAAAIGSMLSLERAMIGTFGNAADPESIVMEAATGAGAFILINLMGIGLILLSGKYGKSGA